MRLIMACMLLCFSAGYSQEVADESPPTEVTTEGDPESGEVAISDSIRNGIDWGCGCGKDKGGKPK